MVAGKWWWQTDDGGRRMMVADGWWYRADDGGRQIWWQANYDNRRMIVADRWWWQMDDGGRRKRHVADVIDWCLVEEMGSLDVCGSSCDVMVVINEWDLSHMATENIKKISLQRGVYIYFKQGHLTTPHENKCKVVLLQFHLIFFFLFSFLFV